MDIELKSGDIVVDTSTGEIGLLVRRYSLFDPPEEFYVPYTVDIMKPLELWAWDIYWTGSGLNLSELSRYQPFTEEGLTNLIKTQTFILKSRS